MPNELELNKARVGALFDFDASTPDVQVSLERTERAIQATVSWIDPSVPYAAWFLPEKLGDPLAVPPSQPPSRLLFHDSHGSILLLDCVARGFHSSFGGAGSGRIIARAAVLDVHHDVDYEHPEGLVSHVSGLREWCGVTSWQKDYTGQGISMRSLETPPIDVGTYKGFEISFRTAWSSRFSAETEAFVLTDLLHVQSTSTDYRPWAEHMDVHHAVRDLLVLSRWHSESCIPRQVSRRDKVVETMDGEEHGPDWPRIVVAENVTKPPTGYHPHLIPFAAIGEAGIIRWMTLRDEFSRALDPIISCNRLRQASPHTLLAHTGPGLEALGYLLLLADGKSESEARKATLKQRLERIRHDIESVASFTAGDWPATWSDAYNAVKHANRNLPDETSLANAWRESVLAVRLWVALRLGVGTEALLADVINDRQWFPYVSTRRSTSQQ